MAEQQSSLTYVEIDVDYCSLTYGVAPCRAQLGFEDGSDPAAVTFDGVNDYLSRGGGLTGAVDSKSATFSCWVRRRGPLLAAGPRLLAGVNTLGGNDPGTRFILAGGSNVFQMQMQNSAEVPVCTIQSSVAPAQDNWVHCLGSIDTTSAAKLHIYVDDVSDLNIVSFVLDGVIDFTKADWGIGGYPGGGNLLNGDLADLWCQFGLYVDFSIEANRRKFIDARGRPVFLGSTGEVPFGAAPIVYMSGNV